MYKLLAFLLLFTTTIALPQVSCIAGTCYPNVRHGQPMYDDWAQHEVEKWKKAEEERKKNSDKHLGDLADTPILVERAEAMKTADNPDMNSLAGVYICEHVAWGGACEYTRTPIGGDPTNCTIIDGKASSIGPDQGLYCIFYTNAFCSSVLSDGSDFLTLTHPGNNDLRFTSKGDFNDRIRSYQCFKNEDSAGTYPDNETKTGVEASVE